MPGWQKEEFVDRNGGTAGRNLKDGEGYEAVSKPA